MNKPKTLNLNGKLTVFVISVLVLLFISCQQFKFPVDILPEIKFIDWDILNYFYSPYIIEFFGLGSIIVLLWSLTLSFLILFKSELFIPRKNKLLLIMVPTMILIEFCSTFTFFRYNPDGIFSKSFGGGLGELIIKAPMEWDRFNPSFINYSVGLARLILINIVMLGSIFPSKFYAISKKVMNLTIEKIKARKIQIQNNKIASQNEEIILPNLKNEDVKATPMQQLDFNENGVSTRNEIDGSYNSHTFDLASNEKNKWILPKEDLLEIIDSQSKSVEEIETKKNLITTTLREHGIEVSVDQVKSGPAVTMYGLSPGYGNSKRVRVDHILAREKDLALALASSNIRFQSPMPGESLVGIEVPNNTAAIVGLRSLISGKKNKEILKEYYLPMALGIGTGNQSVHCDLSKLPHLLVAGATGSGKSVCINSIISGFLMKKTPEELRFVMIDPKRVELTPYNGIPHLLTDPIVEPSEAVKSLKLMIEEMTLRFKILESNNSKNISIYNSKNKVEMPHIVVIVDELADLMLSASSEVEKLLVRLAQLGRATGIHLIVATQRPSVDVVTGLIKANFPSRISFSVTSQIDSRTIIDSPGAEKLLGKGDMLFAPVDNPTPTRAQGIWISDQDIDRIVSHWKNQEIKNPLKRLDLNLMVEENSESNVMLDSDDDLIMQAYNLARGQKTLSTSYLQRRLKIGYPRAARLMDELEEQGAVGPGDAGKARQVLIDGF